MLYVEAFDLEFAEMRRLQEEDVERATERVGLQLDIFLAGPYIDVNGPTPNDGPYVDAARARYEIFHKLLSLEAIESVMGEHNELREVYNKHFRKLSNAALAEFAHICDKSDGVIILPSSPGSFCELGLFSVSESVCRKLLILLDKSRSNPPGYVHLGPVMLAEKDGAQVEYVDYKDLDNIWEIVSEYINDVKARKLSSKYRIR